MKALIVALALAAAIGITACDPIPDAPPELPPNPTTTTAPCETLHRDRTVTPCYEP